MEKKKVRKLGHELLLTRLRRDAHASLKFVNRKEIPVEDLLQCLERADYSLHAEERREQETAPLVHLVSTRKRLNRLSETLKNRGPKNKQILDLLAARFDVAPEAASTIPRRRVLGLHVNGLRRPKKEAVLAVLTLADFFLTRTGSPCYPHVATILKAVFPAQFAKLNEPAVKMDFSEKDEKETSRIVVPPIHNLRGTRDARRAWVLALMRECSKDVLKMEIRDFRKRKSKAWKLELEKVAQENARFEKAVHEAKIQSEQEARKAWERFIKFASKSLLTSGEQRRIEPIVNGLGGWRAQNRWEQSWTVAWNRNGDAWSPIIQSL